MKLLHYKFREYMKLNCAKYNNTINKIDEYLTSKTIITVKI